MQRRDSVSFWRNRIDHAKKRQKDYNIEYGYDRALKEYKGKYKEVLGELTAAFSNIPIIPVNEVKAYMRTFVPAVYSRDPIISVNPLGKKSIKSSKVFEKAINSLWRELKLKHQIRRCIFDAGLGPWGWIKVGYSAVFGTYESGEGKPQFESHQYIKSEEIFAIRESWKNIVYDINAIDVPNDCRWMAQRILKPVDVIKKCGLYDNVGDLEGDSRAIEYEDEKGKVQYYEDVPYAKIWEIWDRDTEEVYVIGEGIDKYLLKKEWPYKMDGFPFISLAFDVNPDENYPQNFVGAWEPQLWEKIKLRSMALDHLKRFGRQLSCEKGSMNPIEKQKFELGKTGSVIEYNKGKTPPTPIQYPPIQTDMYAIMNAIEYDKDNISGQSNIVRGAPQKTQTRTLGELEKLIGSFEGRNSDPQDLIEDFSERIAYALGSLMKEFTNLEKFVKLTQEEAEKIKESLTDDEGNSRFDGSGFTYTKKDISGDYEIDIQAGSTLPLDREKRLNTLASVLKLGASIGVGPNSKVAQVIGKNIMSDLEMYELEEVYQEELDEIESQKMAMQQMAQVTGAGVQEGIVPPLPNMPRGRPAGTASVPEIKRTPIPRGV